MTTHPARFRRALVAALITVAAWAALPAGSAHGHGVTDGPDGCPGGSGGWSGNRWVTWGHYQGGDIVEITNVQIQSSGAPFDLRVWVKHADGSLAFDHWGHSTGTAWDLDPGWTLFADTIGPNWVTVYAAFKRGGYPYCNFPGSTEVGYAH